MNGRRTHLESAYGSGIHLDILRVEGLLLLSKVLGGLSELVAKRASLSLQGPHQAFFERLDRIRRACSKRSRQERILRPERQALRPRAAVVR